MYICLLLIPLADIVVAYHTKITFSAFLFKNIKVMKWYNNFRNVKFILILMAAVIAIASLYVSNTLVSELKSEEVKKVELWAEAMRSLNSVDEVETISLDDINASGGNIVLDGNNSASAFGGNSSDAELNILLKVLEDNNTIPVIVTDQRGAITLHRNVVIPSGTDSLATVMELASAMRKDGQIIRMYLGDKGDGEFIEVCYSDSLLLTRLSYFPYVQLLVVLLFFVVCLLAIISSKRAEQNRVWVGLSKETAHQLGTPISSLMAWTEVLKEKYPSDEMLLEMEHDVARLQRVAERFSKIGSKPEQTAEDLPAVIERSVEYVKRRTPSQVKYELSLPKSPLQVRMNAPLMEWVFENLCKNAVDAMNGEGVITIALSQNENYAFVDITDTGKGIAKSCYKRVFEPGYTTKKRGWGLGLSLAKRIVEYYHKGRIFVKSSSLGKGTTFRLELKK